MTRFEAHRGAVVTDDREVYRKAIDAKNADPEATFMGCSYHVVSLVVVYKSFTKGPYRGAIRETQIGGLMFGTKSDGTTGWF